MKDIVVFSGSAHESFTHKICTHLGLRMSPVRISRFSNDCLQAQLLVNVRQRDVYIVQPLVAPTQDHLMELLLMIQAARSASAAQITAVIPHYAYARSDKKDASRISVGGRLVADLLSTAGVDRVLTMQLHAPQVQGFFSVPVDQLTAMGTLAQYLRAYNDNAVVVSPDFGNAKSASTFARLLGVPVAAGSKRRLGDNEVVIDTIVGDVLGKHCIVMDDEIATGGSILELIRQLKAHGALDTVVACTHGLFAGDAVERLRGEPFIREVVTTDTVPAPSGWPELTVLSVAPLFAEAIDRIHGGKSISKMFEGIDPVYAPPKGQDELF
ncbi:ribose-phosphate diphosphokinase [Propionibacterium cyclohexanicum]|uniref:ribose-phosphate diphosphokinase n=1 Tax=Propionibacterium cyclohexanicum TaxID=64702 RepID=UPI000B898AF4|nr:ribose-phosphate pyrophosphokinase [Propionibacterium cyclohexanicum]